MVDVLSDLLRMGVRGWRDLAVNRIAWKRIVRDTNNRFGMKSYTRDKKKNKLCKFRNWML